MVCRRFHDIATLLLYCDVYKTAPLDSQSNSIPGAFVEKAEMDFDGASLRDRVYRLFRLCSKLPGMASISVHCHCVVIGDSILRKTAMFDAPTFKMCWTLIQTILNRNMIHHTEASGILSAEHNRY